MKKNSRDIIWDKLKSISDTYNNIVLEYATGVGKSKYSLDLVNRWKSSTVLIVIAELNHKNNWLKEIVKWYPKFNLDNITFTTYQSLHKYENTSWNTVILDECHHINTDIRSSALIKIEHKYLIALSATLDNNIQDLLKDILKRVYFYKIDLNEAIDKKILPEPTIIIKPLELNTTNSYLFFTKNIGKGGKIVTVPFEKRWEYMSSHSRALYPNITLNIQCTEAQYYLLLDNDCAYYKRLFIRTKNQGIKNKWMLLCSQRKRFLGSIKTSSVRNLLAKIPNKRAIIFCSSISQANELGGDKSINSEVLDNQSIINDFDNGIINRLFVVNMLKEGQNLKNIETGIITQLDGGILPFIQKLGRVLRAESPEVYIFYYKNTRDEEYLDKALESINKDYVNIFE